MCLEQETGADYLRTSMPIKNYSMILQLPINSKPKNSSENTRIVSFLFNTLQEVKVQNNGIHGCINSNREKLGKSNWIQFRQCLIQGPLLLNPWAALCFLSSIASFLVHHSARRGEDKVHNSDQSSVVSAPVEKGMKAEVAFSMRSQRWGAVLTKARNAGSCSSKARNEKVEDQQCNTWQCYAAPVAFHPAKSSFHWAEFVLGCSFEMFPENTSNTPTKPLDDMDYVKKKY